MKDGSSKKRGKKVMQVIGILFAGLIAIQVAVIVIGLFVHPILSKGELEGISVYGEMVDVDGKKMHVYSLGELGETVVLLPGFGIPLPSADFGPLMRELSTKHTVVTVEFFGVGFSDQTEAPRTNANYIEETRTALKAAGFAPPYILMPHSASGIYAEYYANRYPEEIKGIIMLDTTSTADVPKAPPAFIYSLARLQGRTGVNRINARIIKETKLAANGYTEKEISDHRIFSYHSLHDTLIDQMRRLGENIEEVKTLPFPDSVPVLKLIASESIKHMAKADKDDGMGYQHAHLQRLGSQTTYEVLDASHLMYQTKAREIAELSTYFIDNL